MSQENFITKRYDFVLLFDVKDGNPNGDPDAGNLPRLDAETGNGLVTDVCLKRKIRNFVHLSKQGEVGYDIFVKEKAVLNNAIDEAHDSETVKSKTKDADKTEAARQFMCAKYYDIRTFGAVMSTGKNAGQVRGPVQMTFARSIDPIVSSEHSITRMAVATEEEAKKQKGDNRTMGRKFTVPYGLYRSHGFVSAHLAAQTGFTNDDLNLLWEALEKMFWEDHSAARGEMNVRGLYVFEHSTALGNAPAHELFDAIKVSKKDDSIPARSFDDYKVEINEGNLPAGVSIVKRIG